MRNMQAQHTCYMPTFSQAQALSKRWQRRRPAFQSCECARSGSSCSSCCLVTARIAAVLCCFWAHQHCDTCNQALNLANCSGKGAPPALALAVLSHAVLRPGQAAGQPYTLDHSGHQAIHCSTNTTNCWAVTPALMAPPWPGAGSPTSLSC